MLSTALTMASFWAPQKLVVAKCPPVPYIHPSASVHPLSASPNRSELSLRCIVMQCDVTLVKVHRPRWQ